MNKQVSIYDHDILVLTRQARSRRDAYVGQTLRRLFGATTTNNKSVADEQVQRWGDALAPLGSAAR